MFEDWKYPQSRFGRSWEGEKARWTLATSNRTLLRSEGIRVFSDWYDHPYAILEDFEDEAEPVRTYAGGGRGVSYPTIIN